MANFEIFSQWPVRLPRHEYPVVIGQNFLDRQGFISSYILTERILIITNTKVASLYLSTLLHGLSDKQCDVLILEDGETAKNSQNLMRIYDCLLENNHHRDTTILALGGGVTGDISGFAASTWQRGVDFIQIPTTLLAQVDASVGGKTAINHPLGKNLIGTFYQPKAVLMDLATLKTLPNRELKAGWAEIIKCGLISGKEFLSQIDLFLDFGLMGAENSQLAKVIGRCCQLKASIVEQDEKEAGMRALLNLGHTFAHALETVTEYRRWLHGEAVAIGLYCSALMSERYYGLDRKHLEQLDSILQKADLPRRIPRDLDLRQIRQAMNRDKKIKNNLLRFILIRDVGNCYLEQGVDDATLMDLLQSSVENE